MPRATERGYVDLPLLLSVTALMLFSVAFVYSASSTFASVHFNSSEYLFWHHALRVLLGIVVIFVCARIDYHIWAKVTKAVLLVSLAMLVIVLVVGTRTKGASRWIHFGPVNFQPSEFAKFALVLHLAALLATKQEVRKDFARGFVPAMVWVLMVVVLVAVQPSLSTALSMATIAVAMMFVAGVSRVQLGLTAVGGLVVASLYAVSAPYRMQRIESFLGIQQNVPGAFAQRAAYQVQQAMIAFGNGGFWGVGPGRSRQRELFLPESYGDFIYSIIGEEYGFIGAVAVLACFVLILVRGMKIAKHAPDDFGRFAAFGITITICMYALANAAVTSGLMPTTGLPMPFISYGGTAVLFSAAAVGILLNISSQSGLHPKPVRMATMPCAYARPAAAGVFDDGA